MRVYRFIILIVLAGLTVILLATAVYALQTTPPAPLTHLEESEVWKTAVYPSTPASFFYQDEPAIVDTLP